MDAFAAAGDQLVERNQDGIAEVQQNQQAWQAKGIRSGQSGNAIYTLSGDLRVQTNNKTPGAYAVMDDSAPGSDDVIGSISISELGHTTIDLNNHQLTAIAGEGSGKWKRFGNANTLNAGIYVNRASLTMNNANKLRVEFSLKDGDTGRYGIYVHAQVYREDGEKPTKLIINNDDGMENAVHVISAQTTERFVRPITVAGLNMGRASMTVKGYVNVEGSNSVAAMHISQADVEIGGGAITINDNGKLSMKVEHDSNLTFGKEGSLVQITGDLVSSNRSNTYLNLTTKDSFLRGQIMTDVYVPNAGYGAYSPGQLYLTLKNGAKWTNVHTGSQDWTMYPDELDGRPANSVITTLTSNGGVLSQEGKKITIKSLTGDLKMYFPRHAGMSGVQATDYLGEDVTIQKATEGTRISVWTSATDVPMGDEAQVRNVLNTLASKVIYDEGRLGKNYQKLQGTVGIEESLTAPSVSRFLGDISFAADTGRGKYVATSSSTAEQPPTTTTPQPKPEYTGHIYEGFANDATVISKWTAAGVRDNSGKYTFGMDITIKSKVQENQADAIPNDQRDAFDRFGAIQWNKAGTGTVDMQNHKLTLEGESMNYADAHGVLVTEGVLTIDNIRGGMNISLKGYNDKLGATGNGIKVITKEGKTGGLIINNAGTDNVLKIRSNLTTSTGALIVAQGEVDSHADIDIKGLVDLEKTSGDGANGAAILVRDLGTVRIAGGTISSNGEAIHIRNYGDRTSDVYVNATLGDHNQFSTLNNNRVVIKGDISVGDPENYVEASRLALGLITSDSLFKGKVTTADDDSGKAYLALKNGATWENTGVSTLTQLVGGNDDVTRGVIKQLSTSGKMTIANYEGHQLAIFEHDANTPTTIKGGDIHIKNAVADSFITLRTGNEGLNVASQEKSDKDKVNATLDALAHKLHYESFKNGETKLAGKVEIAEGLTSQSTSQRLENITFTEKDGQGSYVAPKEAEPPVPPTPGETVTGTRQIVEDMNYGEAIRNEWQAAHVYDGHGKYSFNDNVTLDVSPQSPNFTDMWTKHNKIN